jgi:hypothetical protein
MFELDVSVLKLHSQGRLIQMDTGSYPIDSKDYFTYDLAWLYNEANFRKVRSSTSTALKMMTAGAI